MEKKSKGEIKLKILAIKTKDVVYITDANENSYNKSIFTYYKIDGKKPKEGYLKDWYEISKIPTKITKKVSGTDINKRYELKEGYPESELTPKLLEYPFPDEYEAIYGLYTYKSDKTEDTEQEIDFEISIIDETDDFKLIKEDYSVAHTFMDKLKYNPVQLPYRPCSISGEQAYNIIRKYVKEHIDGRYARVSSDYDFHFEVEKYITLNEPLEYQVNINQCYPRRKAKYETRYQKCRSVKVLNIKSKNSDRSYGDDCTIPQPFVGETYEKLIENMNKYLEDLINYINKPLEDCPHCKGMGVIFKEMDFNER